MDRDGYISNGELYLVLKQMVGNNLKVSVSILLSVALCLALFRVCFGHTFCAYGQALVCFPDCCDLWSFQCYLKSLRLPSVLEHERAAVQSRFRAVDRGAPLALLP